MEKLQSHEARHTFWLQTKTNSLSYFGPVFDDFCWQTQEVWAYDLYLGVCSNMGLSFKSGTFRVVWGSTDVTMKSSNDAVHSLEISEFKM